MAEQPETEIEDDAYSSPTLINLSSPLHILTTTFSALHYLMIAEGDVEKAVTPYDMVVKLDRFFNTNPQTATEEQFKEWSDIFSMLREVFNASADHAQKMAEDDNEYPDVGVELRSFSVILNGNNQQEAATRAIVQLMMKHMGEKQELEDRIAALEGDAPSNTVDVIPDGGVTDVGFIPDEGPMTVHDPKAPTPVSPSIIALMKTLGVNVGKR